MEDKINAITRELENVKKDYYDLENTLIHIETSSEYGIGCNLYRYGLCYKVVHKANDITDIMQGLEYLNRIEIFEAYDDIVEELKEYTMKMFKEWNYSIDVNDFCAMRDSILFHIEHNYLLKDILNISIGK